ncbi:MAG: hypothetical protein JO121_32010 [Deltaproteobacteria bacterium]|nr:hypothetical protein [Deltaproteobacteria bacterium]
MRKSRTPMTRSATIAPHLGSSLAAREIVMVFVSEVSLPTLTAMVEMPLNEAIEMFLSWISRPLRSTVPITIEAAH